MLQEDAHHGCVAFLCSIHEHGPAAVGLQVDVRALVQQPFQQFQAVISACAGRGICSGGADLQQAHAYLPTSIYSIKGEHVDRPSGVQPVEHPLPFASLERVEDSLERDRPVLLGGTLGKGPGRRARSEGPVGGAAQRSRSGRRGGRCVQDRRLGQRGCDEPPEHLPHQGRRGPDGSCGRPGTL